MGTSRWAVCVVVARPAPRRDRAGADPAGEEARRHPQGPRAQEEAAGAAAGGRRHCRPTSRPRRAGKKRARLAAPPASRRARARALAPAGPAAPSFGRAVHPLFVTTCKPCHAPGAPGGVSRLLLSGDAAADHKVIARFVNTRDPEASVLLGKVSGATMHAGGAPWPAAGAQYQRVLAWIRGGARLDAAAEGGARRRRRPRRTRRASRRRGAHRRRPAPRARSRRRPARSRRPPGEPAAGRAARRRGRQPAPHPAPPPRKPARVERAAASRRRVHPVLMSACAICHRPGAPGRDDPALAVRAMRRATKRSSGRSWTRRRRSRACSSPRARGEMHGGGAVLPPGDPRLDGDRRLGEGARRRRRRPRPRPRPPPRPRRPAAPAAAPPTAPAPAGGYAAPPGPHAHGGPGGPGLRRFRSGSCSTAASTSPTSAGSSRAARSRRRA